MLAGIIWCIPPARNVEEYPGEERYRRLHTANKMFSQRVWRHELARDIMTAVGWVEVHVKL